MLSKNDRPRGPVSDRVFGVVAMFQARDHAFDRRSLSRNGPRKRDRPDLERERHMSFIE
jgi:hypothetical protein